MHGGKAPCKHGLYSKYTKTRLALRADELCKDEGRLLNLVLQIGMQHALLEQAMETLDAADQARDLRAIVSAVEAIHTLTETISRNIERHARVTGKITDRTTFGVFALSDAELAERAARLLGVGVKT